jgi:ferric-dicitrate binding protein FerR (iron transport regulator)
MDQKKFNKILKKYLSGMATEEERKIVDAWYEDMGDKSMEVVDDSRDQELEQYYWGSISENMRKLKPADTDRKRERTRAWHINYSIGIAASLGIVLVVFSYFLLSDKNSGNRILVNEKSRKADWEQISNTKNAPRLYSLSDGTKITLDPSSSIQIAGDFNKASRDIKLVGRAFFVVAHNPQKPFRVFANGVTTKVLGTSFIIKAFKEDRDVLVSVKTGKVSIYRSGVDTKKIPEIILTPNQQVFYDRKKKTIVKGIVEMPQPLIKTEEIKRLRFEAAPVTEIFLAMEKIYGVDIVFDEVIYSSCKLTTSLANGGLFDRLNIVTNAIGATYTINENTIVISGTGCK